MKTLTKSHWKILALVAAFLIAIGLFLNLMLPPYQYEGITGQYRKDIGGLEAPFAPVPVTTQTVVATTTATAAEKMVKPLSFERMIIYSADVNIEVKDVSKAEEQISNLAVSLGGYVAGSSISGYEETKSGFIVIRVPKDKFSQAINALEDMDEVKSKSISSEDVTEQYIDLKARLENLKAQEKSLLKILDMGKTVQDILDVQRELERVRGDIESLTGRINYIERSAEMSQIRINITEPIPPTQVKPPIADWGEAFNTAFIVLYSVVRGIIILVFALIPFVAIGAPIGYTLYRYSKKRKTNISKAS